MKLSRVCLVALLTATLGADCYKTIIDVLSEDKHARFSTLITHLQHTRLIPTINHLEAGTFFAPDNDAFEDFDQPITQELLLYHLISHPLSTDEFHNGMVIESNYVRPGFLGPKDGQTLKITKNKLVFWHINEARITEKDIAVNNNTTLHVINKVLPTPALLSQVVEKQDKKLHDLFKKVRLDQLLESERPFTTFISSNYLLDKFNQVEKSYLLSEYGKQDFTNLLKFDIISQPIYMDKLTHGKYTYTTESGEELIIVVQNDHITVNGLQVVQSDILAANGVVHQLTDIPYAESIDFDTRKYLIGLNATKFVSLVDEYGLGHYLDSETTNITLLAPTNDVIDEDTIPNSQKKQWLNYHIVNGVWGPDDLNDRMLLETEYTSDQLGGGHQKLSVHVHDRRDLPKSIQFGSGSGVIGSNLFIDGNEIYRISDPLSLPTDIFTSLVVDLDFSTFIATLYVSGVVDEIKNAKGVTVFAPSNEAFHNLGLVSRYLVHPIGRTDLQTVLKYHAASSILYYQELVDDILEVTTLTNETITINGNNKEGKVWIGTGGNDDIPEEHGVIQQFNTLVANGVVHKVNRLQIPHYVNITHANLLKGINANLMLDLLERTGLLDTIGTDYLLLCPTDKAFGAIDLENLWNDTAKMERIAKLHIVPKSEEHKKWLYPLLGAHEYSTMLSGRDRVIIREAGPGNNVVIVKGQPYGARVLDIGKVSTGTRAGGVLEIDAVLIPVDRGVFGLPLFWSVLFVGCLWLISIGLLFGAGFFLFKKWKRRNQGYTEILDAERNEEIQEHEGASGHQEHQTS
ncbi:FAS1 domain-containing protein [Backusella circina FSU 941]|nr:FAS1 domain-containing protein [Backusella circina FSU 941]